MPEEDILAQINALSVHLARYRPSPRERAVGRSQAYRERLCQGKLPMRQYRAKISRGQVPMLVRRGELIEAEEFGTNIA